jgi:hypothetical protein
MEKQKYIPIIALCCPGEVFHQLWVWAHDDLRGDMTSNGYGVASIFAHTSDVCITRSMIFEGLMQFLNLYDYILWVDDDNLVNWEQVKLLIEDLDTYPDISMIAGWCYIQKTNKEIVPSCGFWVDQRYRPMSIEELEDSNRLIEIDCTGFPVVLMRPTALITAGESPFLPRVGPQYGRWGKTGEDISFCLNLKENGGRIMVDPRVRVEHLKFGPVGYTRPAMILPEAGHIETKGVNAECLQ